MNGLHGKAADKCLALSLFCARLFSRGNALFCFARANRESAKKRWRQPLLLMNLHETSHTSLQKGPLRQWIEKFNCRRPTIQEICCNKF
jgi:hypothetical protein